MIKRPMLATKAKLSKINFPVLVSAKLDGIRCFKINDEILTRSLKPIPNEYMRRVLNDSLPNGIDGEIIVPGAEFKTVTSAVMSFEGEPEFEFHAFDYFGVGVGLDAPFRERYNKLVHVCNSYSFGPLRLVEHHFVKNLDELLMIHHTNIQLGYEGTMVRSVDGPYKQGRSTIKEGFLLKIKDFVDEEAEIVGMDPLYTNLNPATINALGYTERSTKQENKVAKEMLGALLLQFTDGTKFGCGTGFTEQNRIEMWKNQLDLQGKFAKIKYQGPRRQGEAPRFPVFLGIRNKRDA